MAIVNLPDTLDPVRRARLRSAVARVLTRQIIAEWRAEAEAALPHSPVEDEAKKDS